MKALCNDNEILPPTVIILTEQVKCDTEVFASQREEKYSLKDLAQKSILPFNW